LKGRLAPAGVQQANSGRGDAFERRHLVRAARFGFELSLRLEYVGCSKRERRREKKKGKVREEKGGEEQEKREARGARFRGGRVGKVGGGGGGGGKGRKGKKGGKKGALKEVGWWKRKSGEGKWVGKGQVGEKSRAQAGEGDRAGCPNESRPPTTP